MMSAGLFFDFGLWTFWRLLLLFQSFEALLKGRIFQRVVSGWLCPIHPLISACAQRMGQAVFVGGLHTLRLGFDQGFADIRPAVPAGIGTLAQDLTDKLFPQPVEVSGKLGLSVGAEPAETAPELFFQRLGRRPRLGRRRRRLVSLFLCSLC